MDSALTRRRCALLLGSAGLSALASGCSSLLARKPASSANDDAATVVQTTPDPIRIIYRTRTDRLNLAGAKLPHCSIAELRIDFPHDQYKAAMCRAVVRATSCSESATPFPERGITSAVTSAFNDSPSAAAAPPTAALSADVPLWEVQALIKSLEQLHFFHKHRTVLSAEVYLSVETGKYAVGKKYRPVAELDALILRVVQEHQSWQLGAAAPTSSALPDAAPRLARAELARLPAFE